MKHLDDRKRKHKPLCALSVIGREEAEAREMCSRLNLGFGLVRLNEHPQCLDSHRKHPLTQEGNKVRDRKNTGSARRIKLEKQSDVTGAP